MAVFPMFIELEREICLIIGGGKVALRKAEALLDMGAEVHVISRKFEPELLELQTPERLECHEIDEGPLAAAVWLEQNARKEGIGDVAMLICATDDERVNHQMVLWARKNGFRQIRQQIRRIVIFISRQWYAGEIWWLVYLQAEVRRLWRGWYPGRFRKLCRTGMKLWLRLASKPRTYPPGNDRFGRT
ncbi:MAG: bifunctional precorrin-2 dehydrogenase/sirohydrochlorin ferrochelatase [Frisingicoccus sp.]